MQWGKTIRFYRSAAGVGLLASRVLAVLGGLADILMEIWMINIGVYKYTQIAGPSLWWGNAHLQVTEFIWVGLLIAGTAVLMRRDDKGRSFAAVLAKSNRTLRRLRLGEFGTTFILVRDLY